VFKDSRMIVELIDSDPVCTLRQLLLRGSGAGPPGTPPGGGSGGPAPPPQPLGEDAARYIAASVAVALDHMHRAHKILRSLSLDSIVLTATGQVHLVDLRYARDLEGHCYSVTGVPEFLAPEVVEQKGYTEAADWWAFGVLIYSMLVGRTPFAAAGENELLLYQNITAGSYSVPPCLTPDAAAAIQSFIVREPMQRLGVVGQGTALVKQHPWFRAVRWDQLEAGTHAVPRPLVDALAALPPLENQAFVMAEVGPGQETRWVEQF
jgi:protein kinase A